MSFYNLCLRAHSKLEKFITVLLSRFCTKLIMIS